MGHDDFDSDNPFNALTQDDGDTRWAFGTGFHDPLAGIDASVPDGLDPGDLAAYCLMLGDDALIMSHRLQEWCTHAPELEEEVALANIALDLLGQARLLLAQAAPPRTRAGARTTSPTSGTRPSSATSASPRCRTATSRSRPSGCCCSRRGGWRCWTGSPRPATRSSPRSPRRA